MTYTVLSGALNSTPTNQPSLLDIPVAMHHNRFFSEPPTTTRKWLFSEPPMLESTQQTFSQMKKFCNSQVSVVTFSGGWTSGLQFVFF